MDNVNLTNTPYDDVFRTLLNDCSSLVIPLINELFQEHYSGKETIVFSPNEHFLNRQDGNEDKRITDSSFIILGEEPKKYHLECQSSTDNTMLIRFFEYDTQIALDEGELKGNVLTVTFPHSAVLFLRCNASTPDTLKLKMVTPGGTMEKDRLEYLMNQGAISEFTRRTIIDMSNKVLAHIAAKYDTVRKGVRAVMVGRVLEYKEKKEKTNYEKICRFYHCLVTYPCTYDGLRENRRKNRLYGWLDFHGKDDRRFGRSL